MSNNQIIMEKIKSCYDIKGNISFKKISNALHAEILQITDFLDEYNPSISERIFCIINNISKVPVCPLTNEKLKYNPNKKGYADSKTVAYKNRKITLQS